MSFCTIAHNLPGELRDMLAKARTIAIIGAKDKPGQPVDRVGRYLMQAGYTVIPVHPVRKSVWGLAAYEKLADIPVPVDIVNLFRAPEYCADHARETLALAPSPSLFWMQSGIQNEEACRLLAHTGTTVIENACLMVEHARLFKGTPLV